MDAKKAAAAAAMLGWEEKDDMLSWLDGYELMVDMVDTWGACCGGRAKEGRKVVEVVLVVV